MMEELVWHPESGALLTHAPSTYTIPAANDTSARFAIALFDSPTRPTPSTLRDLREQDAPTIGAT